METETEAEMEMEMEMEMKLMKYFCELFELSYRSCSVVVAQHKNYPVFISINEYCQLKKQIALTVLAKKLRL